MRRRQRQRKIGLWLSIWCVVFGLLHVLWIKSFTVTIVPSVSGLDTPSASVVVFSIASGALLLLAGGLVANLSDSQPSVIVGRYAAPKRVLLLVLSLAALVRVAFGVPAIVGGEAPVMAIVAEAWFLVAGIAGMMLWVTLLGRKRDLQR